MPEDIAVIIFDAECYCLLIIWALVLSGLH